MLPEPAIDVAESRGLCRPPPGNWRWSQQWRNVLFAHWQVPAELVRRHLPPSLELETWQDSAWVSAVAFRLQDVRLRGLPTCGPCSNLVELNLRTYIRRRGESAIYFFSVHADTRLAVFLARRATPLPYRLGRIVYTADGDRAHFCCENRTSSAQIFDARLQTHGESSALPPDSLDAWLLERYRAFVPRQRGGLYRMSVEHPQWQVQGGSLAVAAPSLGEPWGFDLSREPDLWHYSAGTAAYVWPFELIS